jgi:hypothetical protein
MDTEPTLAILIAINPQALEVGTLDDYFAGGAGALHIYGHKTPWPLNLAQV